MQVQHGGNDDGNISLLYFVLDLSCAICRLCASASVDHECDCQSHLGCLLTKKGTRKSFMRVAWRMILKLSLEAISLKSEKRVCGNHSIFQNAISHLTHHLVHVRVRPSVRVSVRLSVCIHRNQSEWRTKSSSFSCACMLHRR